MTDYYLDADLTTGLNNGLTAPNAWQSLSDISGLTAGDNVLLTGTDSITSTYTFSSAGDETNGFIGYIGGYNSSFVRDGTKFVVDAVGLSAADALVPNAAFNWFEDIEVKNSDNDGLDPGTSANDCTYVRCLAHTNGGAGWGSGGGSRNLWLFCQSYNNTGGDGFSTVGGSALMFGCSAWGNDAYGFDGQTVTAPIFVNCVAHDNGASGDYGFYGDSAMICINCVADSEVIGIGCADGVAKILACRITNNTTGLSLLANANCSRYGFNVFDSNTTDVSDSSTDSRVIKTSSDADTNKYDPDADDGYAAGADDFNLVASRTYNGDGTDTVGLGIGA